MFRPKTVFIIDFDNTLFDIERFKNSLIGKFPNKLAFTKLYKNAKLKSGHFNPENLPENFKDLFLKANFSKYLFPKTIADINKLQKMGRVILFSFGDDTYQSLKIEKSGIGKLVGKNNTVIVQDKKGGVEKLIRKLKKEKYTEITIIDDVAEVLEKAYEKYPQVRTIWVRYGKYKNKLPVMRNSVTYEASSFSEAVKFAENFVTSISFPKSHVKFPVLRNIGANQIADLISYTGRDKKISVFTHDDGRFKTKKSFTSWVSRGKTIYSLINGKGKLLGLIWFARKKYGKFTYTFAIRIYPPVRGKGLSLKFMKPVVNDFRNLHKNVGFWLAMQKGNIPAEHLYKKFGLKPKEEKGNEVIMTSSK